MSDHTQFRTLRATGRRVACQPDLATIALHTRCPKKYAIVDLETGDVWGHDGDTFRRLEDEFIEELIGVVTMPGQS